MVEEGLMVVSCKSVLAVTVGEIKKVSVDSSVLDNVEIETSDSIIINTELLELGQSTEDMEQLTDAGVSPPALPPSHLPVGTHIPVNVRVRVCVSMRV